MKKRIILAVCSLLIMGGGIGMTSIHQEELPVSEELLAEAMAEPEEEIEEMAEVKLCLEGCTLEEGHEGDCVLPPEEKDIEVVLKTTSMERDLKVKFVNKATGKVISGADFKMKLTGPSKTTKEYSDHDNDGIIWVKDIEGGTYTVAMLDLKGFITPKELKADVKKKLEYKVVEVQEEVKKENQIVVSQEDAAYGGTDKDESTSGSAVLKDTVEFVASSQKETEKKTNVQVKDKFNQPVYEKQKVDQLGQPMYAKILSESEEFHTYNDQGVCTRCKAKKSCEHKYENCVCTKCQDVKHETLSDGVCPKCGKVVDANAHTAHTLGENGMCKYCSTLVDETKHVCVDENGDNQCDQCKKEVTSTPPQQDSSENGNGDSGDTNQSQNDGEGTVTPQSLGVENPITNIGIFYRPLRFIRASEGRFIKYDTSSAPVYDTNSTPVYETKKETTYYGWQTIDGATYYFDKNGNKVTGQQVIQGISYTFSSDGVRSGTIGIDVSRYQSGINWTKVKNAGINFVMIRCGYRGYGSGALVEDPMYASHISGAKAAGLRVGVYFFSQAVNEAEAVEEASMAVSLANKYGINMPIAIDSEYAAGGRGRADGLSKSARTAITKAFCNTVRSAGHTPMVYASKSWFGSHLNASELSGYRIWVAHYADKCGYTGTYHIWQNTDKGTVDGVPGRVDMNISSI